MGHAPELRASRFGNDARRRRAIVRSLQGDPDGEPVLALHGAPGSRLGRTPLQDELRATGLRVVSHARPG